MNDMLSKIGLSTDLIVKFLIGIGIIIWIFIIAKIIANMIGKLIGKAKFIKKAFKIIDVKLDMEKIGNIFSKILYYTLLLIGIVIGLSYAGIIEQSAVNGLVNNYLMNFLNAAGLALVAWFLAVLAKAGITKWTKSINLDKKIHSKESEISLSETAGTIWYWVVILFFITPILEKLGQEELVAPIKNIIENITWFIPNLIWAVLIFIISYFVAKIIKQIITGILWGIGFDKILNNIGLKNIESKTSPSKIVGTIVFSYILLLAWAESANTVGFDQISDIINNIIVFATNILIWVVILGIGIYIANLVSDLIKSTSKSQILPIIAKVAIIVLTGFMGLKQMWIGWDIIDQAFTLILWSIAVAFAIAVGLGSKEIAGAEVKKIIDNIHSKKNDIKK